MDASILDLRYRRKSVLAALDRGEPVTVFHRGREKALLLPVPPKKSGQPLTEHPAFGMWRDRKDMANPGAFARKLRTWRRHDL